MSYNEESAFDSKDKDENATKLIDGWNEAEKEGKTMANSSTESAKISGLTATDFDFSKLPYDELKELIIIAQNLLKSKEQARLNDIQAEIRRLAQSIDMSPEEVIMQMNRSSSRGSSEVKYRNPENESETWAGRGKRPNWLLDKLSQGHDLEDFKV